MTCLIRKRMLYLIGCLILLACVLLSCDEALVERAAPGDYFPLDEQSRWEYATTHTYGCCGSDAGLVLRDTLRLHTEEALFVDGSYYNLVDQRTWIYKTVRKRMSQYHELPAYSPEFMFLDPTVPVGVAWTSDSVMRCKMQVTGINLAKTLNGTTYQHVIEVKQTSLNSNDPASVHSTTVHYYAKDVGLIESVTTYGEPGQQSTIETTLLRYWRE